MELNTARDVNGNKKSFRNYISSRRKTVENVSTMLNKTGDLVTWDGEKVLEDFFALVFTPQETPGSRDRGQRLAEGSHWGSVPPLQALTLSCGSHQAPGAPLDAATPVPREPPAAVRGVTRDTGGLLGQAQRLGGLLLSRRLCVCLFFPPPFPACSKRAQMPLLWLGSLGRQPEEAPETPCVSA